MRCVENILVQSLPIMQSEGLPQLPEYDLVDNCVSLGQDREKEVAGRQFLPFCAFEIPISCIRQPPEELDLRRIVQTGCKGVAKSLEEPAQLRNEAGHNGARWRVESTRLAKWWRLPGDENISIMPGRSGAWLSFMDLISSPSARRIWSSSEISTHAHL